MYLPDPRNEVVVKRKLTPRQCSLWYPGNDAVYMYNTCVIDKEVSDDSNEIAAMEDITDYNPLVDSGFSRKTSYTKPRTIMLDNKFEGVVTIDVWTGYAVDVVSKSGKREVVCGPKTVILDYDQTLEELQLSSGKPKNTDNLVYTPFLRCENNKVSDIIVLETKDFVKCNVKVSYCVDFLPEHKDHWFSVDNYVKYLCDRERSLMKRAVKNYTIEEFYQNYVDIIRNIAIDADENNTHNGRFFPENGMCVHDCEVLSLTIDRDVEEMILAHQHDLVQKTLELSDTEHRVRVARQMAIAEEEEAKLKTNKAITIMDLNREKSMHEIEIKAEISRREEEEATIMNQAKLELSSLLDGIHKAELDRRQADMDQQVAFDRKKDDLQKARQDSYANTVSRILGSIGPELTAALSSRSNEKFLESLNSAIAPYAIAKGESISDTVNKLIRGLPIDQAIMAIQAGSRQNITNQ